MALTLIKEPKKKSRDAKFNISALKVNYTL